MDRFARADVSARIAPRSVRRGLMAGALGGAAGSAAKLIVEAIAPPRPAGQTPPPALLVERAAGHSLAPPQRAAASQAIHWPFGIALGVLAEFYPEVTDRGGADFGVVLWALAHEAALPLLRLSPPPQQMSVYEQGNELSTHAVYGVITEAVRRFIRGALN